MKELQPRLGVAYLVLLGIAGLMGLVAYYYFAVPLFWVGVFMVAAVFYGGMACLRAAVSEKWQRGISLKQAYPRRTRWMLFGVLPLLIGIILVFVHLPSKQLVVCCLIVLMIGNLLVFYLDRSKKPQNPHTKLGSCKRTS